MRRVTALRTQIAVESVAPRSGGASTREQTVPWFTLRLIAPTLLYGSRTRDIVLIFNIRVVFLRPASPAARLRLDVLFPAFRPCVFVMVLMATFTSRRLRRPNPARRIRRRHRGCRLLYIRRRVHSTDPVQPALILRRPRRRHSRRRILLGNDDACTELSSIIRRRHRTTTTKGRRRRRQGRNDTLVDPLRRRLRCTSLDPRGVFPIPNSDTRSQIKSVQKKSLLLAFSF